MEPQTRDDPPDKLKREQRKRPVMLRVGLGLGGAALMTLAYFVITTRQHAPRLTRAEYVGAVERWDQNGPDDYDLDLELLGNRPGKICVEVRGGEEIGRAHV